MAQVINGLLTSKVNAGSLTRGDVVIRNGIVQEIQRTEHRGPTGASFTRLRGANSAYVSIKTSEEAFWIGINTPMDRVVGARSAGQIN